MYRKKDLQAELETLRQQVETHGSTNTSVTYVGPSEAPVNIATGSTMQQQSTSSVPSPASLDLTSAASIGQTVTSNPERSRLDERILTASTMPTLPRRIGDLEISSHAIDACYDLYVLSRLTYDHTLRPHPLITMQIPAAIFAIRSDSRR